MARRTREADAELIETVDDLEELVKDKRESWRANASKARRRQRRYKNRLTNELARMDIGSIGENDETIVSTTNN
jgi:hypothetical protein